MWGSVVDKLSEQGAVGNKLPITCHRHPEEERFISKPGDLPRWSPDGKTSIRHPFNLSNPRFRLICLQVAACRHATSDFSVDILVRLK